MPAQDQWLVLKLLHIIVPSNAPGGAPEGRALVGRLLLQTLPRVGPALGIIAHRFVPGRAARQGRDFRRLLTFLQLFRWSPLLPCNPRGDPAGVGSFPNIPAGSVRVPSGI
jgi:hypothetical protein